MQCNFAILRVSECDAKSHLSIAEREQYRHEVSITERSTHPISDEITARRWWDYGSRPTRLRLVFLYKTMFFSVFLLIFTYLFSLYHPKENYFPNFFVSLQLVRGKIRTNEEAFAIILRWTKMPRRMVRATVRYAPLATMPTIPRFGTWRTWMPTT